MSDLQPDVTISFDGPVATVEICRPPHNFFDIPLIQHLADAFEDLEADRRCHAIVLAAQGSSFCAGANFVKQPAAGDAHAGADPGKPLEVSRDATPAHRSPRAINPLYGEAIRMFSCSKPVVAAVQGPAIGGGLGLALVADFRVTSATASASSTVRP